VRLHDDPAHNARASITSTCPCVRAVYRPSPGWTCTGAGYSPRHPRAVGATRLSSCSSSIEACWHSDAETRSSPLLMGTVQISRACRPDLTEPGWITLGCGMVYARSRPGGTGRWSGSSSVTATLRRVMVSIHLGTVPFASRSPRRPEGQTAECEVPGRCRRTRGPGPGLEAVLPVGRGEVPPEVGVPKEDWQRDVIVFGDRGVDDAVLVATGVARVHHTAMRRPWTSRRWLHASAGRSSSCGMRTGRGGRRRGGRGWMYTSSSCARHDVCRRSRELVPGWCAR